MLSSLGFINSFGLDIGSLLLLDRRLEVREIIIIIIFFEVMAMEDTESCSSRAVDSSPTHTRQQRCKLEVYNEVLRRLKESESEEANRPGFDDELWAHFNRLPARSQKPNPLSLSLSISFYLCVFV